jgi:predicted metal-dependent peptidase
VSQPEAPAPAPEAASPETPARADRAVRGSLLRLRSKSPFFATLALFAPFRAEPNHPTAATDGREVIYNPAFIAGLPPVQVDGVMMHEVLHAALLHVPRRGTRDAKLWNIAADYVVNGVLAASGFELPEGVLRDANLEHFSVEEVYALLEKSGDAPELRDPDLLESDGGDGEREGGGAGQTPGGGLRDAKALERYWREAMEQATSAARGLGQGKLPAGLERAAGEITAERLDWKTILWRFLTRTPTDFAGYDRRFVYARQYIETLESESVKVYVCVDTSGSVEDEQVQGLLSEVRAIARAYPHATAQLYYADAAVYGPYDLEAPGNPQGGGGTDFRPFFKAIASEDLENAVAVYLTDGYGDFPSDPPDLPVLWVVTPGGLERFPFGETVRLVDGA